ncbi:hypothetical protein Mpsy_3082 [Methanolobus psychrophilus R15]|nr:hypothetical protein Mpsy_3082 [Methanolobus psychrophilus R15]
MEITQLTELELITKIPKEKLVPAICEFYWAMGHKTVRLIRGSGDDKTYEDYSPVKGVKNAGEVSGIVVVTHKQRELGFGSVQITIKEGIFETKIMWGVDMKNGVFHLYAMYVLVSFIVSIYYGWNMCPIDSFWRKYCAALFATAFIFILILPAYYSFNRSIKKINSHPSTERYKTDFEEFIRKKEKELLSERY